MIDSIAEEQRHIGNGKQKLSQRAAAAGRTRGFHAMVLRSVNLHVHKHIVTFV